MRGGKNRISVDQHRIAGTFRRDRHGSGGDAQESTIAVPPPPAGLSRRERAVWAELAAQVEERGSYTATRRTAFRLMVVAVVRLDAAKAAPAYAWARLLTAANDALLAFGLAPLRTELPPPRRKPNRLDEFTLRALPGGRHGAS